MLAGPRTVYQDGSPRSGLLGGVILTFQIMRIDVVSGKQATRIADQFNEEGDASLSASRCGRTAPACGGETSGAHQGRVPIAILGSFLADEASPRSSLSTWAKY